MPRCLAQAVADPEMPFFFEGTYLAQPMRRVDRGDGAQLVPLSEVRRIELDADVLTGNSRSFRDDLSGRDGFADLPELL